MSNRHFHPWASMPSWFYIVSYHYHTIICVFGFMFYASLTQVSICEIGLKFTSKFNKKIDSKALKEKCGTSIKIFTQTIYIFKQSIFSLFFFLLFSCLNILFLYLFIFIVSSIYAILCVCNTILSSSHPHARTHARTHTRTHIHLYYLYT